MSRALKLLTGVNKGSKMGASGLLLCATWRLRRSQECPTDWISRRSVPMP